LSNPSFTDLKVLFVYTVISVILPLCIPTAIGTLVSVSSGGYEVGPSGSSSASDVTSKDVVSTWTFADKYLYISSNLVRTEVFGLIYLIFLK
jgi:hypothetical protein